MPYRRVCLISGCALVKLHCICEKHGFHFLKFFEILAHDQVNVAFDRVSKFDNSLTSDAKQNAL